MEEAVILEVILFSIQQEANGTRIFHPLDLVGVPFVLAR